MAGWTPGLRALVDGRLLPCGCLVGTYETWIGTHVTIIDGRGDACPIAAHMPNAVL